jgi:hypothetical protein
VALTSFFDKGGSYTNEQMGDLFKAILIGDNSATEGVIKHPVSGPDNLLAVTESGAKTVAVDTGWAVVDRRVIYNDASALVTLPDGACTGTIVLRFVNAGSVASFEYVPTGTSLTQTPGTQFELPIATYAVAVTTNTVTVTDARTFVARTLLPQSFINETTNATMTVGLTINQGAADDEILALKSSDVNHGMTDYFETDTYGSIMKYSAEGGLTIHGINGAAKNGLQLIGTSVGDISTVKTVAAVGPVILRGNKSDGGTGDTSLGANANVVVARNDTATVWIVDAEGDTWQSGEALIGDTAMVPGFLGRQGGSATDWTTAGTTHYETGISIRIQCGSIQSVGESNASVTFPVAFSQKPLVFITPGESMSTWDLFLDNISASGFTIVDTSPVAPAVFWLAIGPK